MNFFMFYNSTMIAIEELTIAEVHLSFKYGSYNCRQLIEAFLERIRKLDKNGPKLNSLLAHSGTALEEADRLDTFFKETGNLIGPLHGIPAIVKDQLDTKGIVTTYGSIVAKDHVPMEDAAVVTKLKQAGAIVLAKSTMPGERPPQSLIPTLKKSRLGSWMAVYKFYIRLDEESL